MTSRRVSILICLFFLACGGGGSGAASAQSTQAVEPEVHKLTVRAAAPAERPLRHRLVPPYEHLTPGNAAPVYMAAMLVLANQPQEWHEQVDRLQALPVEQLPRDEVRALLKEAQPMLDQLHVAARRERCDWDLPRREHGAMALLPHLHRMRPFVRLLSLYTRLAAVEGRYDDAAASLQTSIALVHDCQDDGQGLLLDGLVAARAGEIALDDVAVVTSRPDGPNLYWGLATLPHPFLDVTQIIRRERGMFYLVFPALRDPARSGLTDAQWRQIEIDVLHELKAEPPTKEELVEFGKQIDRINAAMLPRARALPGMEGATDAQAIANYAVAEMERWRDEREKWFGLPFWQGHPGLVETDRAIRDAQAKNPNPLMTTSPKTATWFRQLIRPDRKAAALQTIEAIRAHGKVPAKLEEVSLPLPVDPASGVPFRYEPRDGGFTLISRIEGGDAPDEIRYDVTMK